MKGHAVPENPTTLKIGCVSSAVAPNQYQSLKKTTITTKKIM